MHKSRGLHLTGCIPGEQEGLLRTHVIVKCEFTATTVTNHQKNHTNSNRLHATASSTLLRLKLLKLSDGGIYGRF